MDITMKFSKYEILQGNFSNNLLAAMNRNGVYQDEQAGIQIHEEENFIDLSCFNCIVVNGDRIDSDQPQNKWAP
jgi:hypothetical protein